MKKLLLITCILASCSTHYQSRPNPPELVSLHLIDRDGMTEVISNSERLKNYECTNFLEPQSYQKALRVYSRNPDGSIPAYITSYHPNGQVKQYLEVVNNRARGTYREWYPNGVLKVEAVLIEGNADLTTTAENSWLFDDLCRAFDEEGNLIAEIPYVKGSINGTAMYYHANGSVWKEIPYTNNAICGEMRIFLDNGDLFLTSSFVNGVNEGKSLRYWSPENVAAEETYCKGYLREGLYYNRQRELIAEIHDGTGYRAIFGKDTISELQEYHYGSLDGEVKAFDIKGNIVKAYHIKNGVQHGEELFYYPAIANKPSLPKLSIPWYEGKVQGVAKTWYDNGSQESQKEISGNKRNGVSTAWYRDGQLMFIEEYDQDQLVKGDYFRKGERHPVSQVMNGEGIVTFFDAEGNYVRKANYQNGQPNNG